MAEDWEVAIVELASDVKVLRNDVKNMRDNAEREKDRAKPAEDRAKQIDAMMKAALAGLVILEGLARAPTIEVGTSAPSNGAVIFFGGIVTLIQGML